MPDARHWTESLFDSVYALYETAHEYQLAHRAAQLAVESVNFERRTTHEGRVALEGRTNAYGRTLTQAPHDRALAALSRVYQNAETQMQRRYEQSALLYASGAAWAIRTVQSGGTPAHVTFETDPRGDAVPRALHTPGLDRYAGAAALAAAYDAVRRCMDADEHGEDLAGRDYVTEHEAGEMFRAIQDAEGMADAAFAYGLLAQGAFRHVLLEPRRDRERELAAARANDQVAAHQPTA